MNYTQCGSALALPYADGIAQTCVTSPPYYGLRDYGTARWDGGDAGCDHTQRNARNDGNRKGVDGFGGNNNAEGHADMGAKMFNDICGKCGAKRIDSQIGLEQTPAAYVAQIVAAMREVWRVLRDDGTLFINLGDSFGPNKQLQGIPWRVAFALQDDGWYLRSDIIWAKPNPMPESVTDRPTKAHEYVFLLAKQPRYFYDAEAIKEGNAAGTVERARYGIQGIGKGEKAQNTRGDSGNETWEIAGTRNARSVWQIATTPYAGAHFATMPPELARRCILAGTSARGECPKCGAPWGRMVDRFGGEIHEAAGEAAVAATGGAISGGTKASRLGGGQQSSVTTGWAATCDCNAGDPVPQIVLDPFAGSGTTAMVALQNGRRAIGTELNPKYLRLQDDRTQVTIGLGMVLA